MKSLNKKIITVFILCSITAFIITSCSKSFIDLTDPTKIVTSAYYNDSASMATAVVAAYSSLQDVYGKSSGSRGIFPYGEIVSDNSYALVDGASLGDFEYFTITSGNTVLQSSWTYMYRGIARCNIVLSRMSNVPVSDATKSRWGSEVKFIRALMYFNMVRIWGAVPLVTKQIEKDLTDAEADANIPVTYSATTNLGRVTKPAVKGLLAKVYLTEQKYTDAANKLKEFITTYDGAPCTLLSTYSNIFLTTNEMNSEIIFAVRYSKGNTPTTGSPFSNYFAVNSATAGGVGTGYQYNSMRKDLIDTLTANGAADTRVAASYVQSGTSNIFYVTKKYTDVPAADLDADCDWIVLRYADVLLMYAEALNEQSASNVATAIPYVNRVRTRAGLAALNAASYNQATLRLAIEKERRIELNMEGHRWFDLVRTGRAIDVMNNHFTKYAIRLTSTSPIVQIDSHNLLFPVPISEINTNPILTQNPGY